MSNTYYIDTSLLIVDFLRSNLKDPANRITFETNNSFTATNQRVIPITATTQGISHISNVRIDGVESVKYKSWFYDPKFNNLVFYDNVTGTITYDVYVGNNWIYHDRPLESLGDNQFPRVTIYEISNIGVVLGNDKSKIVIPTRFQSTVFTKQGKLFEVDIVDGVSKSMEGQELANYINNSIYTIFEKNRSSLYPMFANYELENKKGVMSRDEALKGFMTTQDFTLLQLKTEL